MSHYITLNNSTLEEAVGYSEKGRKIELHPDAISAINKCRNYLDQKTENSQKAFYGINTGFGALSDIKISADQMSRLQLNLVMSHACGFGDLVPDHIVRLMLWLKIKSLSQGYSGVSYEVVQALVDLYNADLLPVIYQQGSLGASGDLAPLAHLTLPILGLGEVWEHGERKPASEVLGKYDIKPVSLRSKEGLALLNGTQFSTAYAVWCVAEAKRLYNLANLTASVSIDAFACDMSPYDSKIHHIRPHEGQIHTAEQIRKHIEGSGLQANPRKHVQDPYAFRCVPQVHGASYDAIAHIEKMITIELNAVTDNPNVFPDADAILSGGNFHAQPVALPLDYLCIALSELGSISERRTFQMVSGKRELPAFLTPDPGLNSGMMIPQYTAASIASQNKQLSTPASVDSIVSSMGQEDHVSMAANAATKAYQVVRNTERILSIEFMVSMQALELRLPIPSSPQLERLRMVYRQVVPALGSDRILSTDMHQTLDFLKGIKATEY